jgi:hypothetical protein
MVTLLKGSAPSGLDDDGGENRPDHGHGHGSRKIGHELDHCFPGESPWIRFSARITAAPPPLFSCGAMQKTPPWISTAGLFFVCFAISGAG